MTNSFDMSDPITIPALVQLADTLSNYLVPEYYALFSGWKKLTEKAYGYSDSSIPCMVPDTFGR